MGAIGAVAVVSVLAAVRKGEAGGKATSRTSPPCAVQVSQRRHVPSLCRLKTRILPSTEPVAQRSPYVLNVMACTRSLWPCCRLSSNGCCRVPGCGFSSMGGVCDVEVAIVRGVVPAAS